LNKRS